MGERTMKIKHQVLLIVTTILLILLFVSCEQSLIESLQRVTLLPGDKIVFTMGYPDGESQTWTGTVLSNGVALSTYGKVELIFMGNPTVLVDGSVLYRVEYGKKLPDLDYNRKSLLLHVDSKGTARLFEDTDEKKEKYVLLFVPGYQGDPQDYDPADFTIMFAED